MMKNMDDIEIYLSGKKLYGDDFDSEEIKGWFEDEREGYADLGAKDSNEADYEYHALNQFHGFRYLPAGVLLPNVLGFGSCYGGEFLPIADRIGKLTIVDPSEAFVRHSVFGIDCEYVKPVDSGTLPFADESFDLFTCFGVLHHIPNVSYVIGELARCLKPGGYGLIREPIVSMGDWRNPRPGLTKRERGLPIDLFAAAIDRAGLVTMHTGLCVFRPIPKIGDRFRVRVYNVPVLVALDAFICNLLRYNVHYHATTPWQKWRPQSAYLVVQKQPRVSPPDSRSV